MPFVHIEWVEGRSLEQKREIAKRVTATISEVANVPPERVHVIFNDMKQENYGFGGELVVDRNKK